MPTASAPREPLEHTAIRWTLDPLIIPCVEQISAADLIRLDPDALLEYAFELQRALAAVREVADAACARLAHITATQDPARLARRQRRR